MEQKEYASKGVAGTGLGLGIAGTALGLLRDNGGLGGILGGGSGMTTAAAAAIPGVMSAWANAQNSKCSELESKIAQLTAEKYTDGAIGMERDRRLALEEKTIGFTLDIEKRLSVLEASLPLKEQILTQKIDNVAQMAGSGIQNLQNAINGVRCQAKEWVDQEAERRCCADNKIVSYGNSVYAAQGVADPTYATTATAKAFYNPLTCQCG
ncbi:MAG: hypothetical protein J1G30_04300 [Spirochaetales bacterium]|nr:hypothetical protein [Spirochaetales bacterium]